MGCNCKAASRIVRTKKTFGYDLPTSRNVKIGTKIKMFIQALLIWMVLILFLPITLVIIVMSKLFRKDINFFNKIKIRL